MNFILVDTSHFQSLLPLTYTRSSVDIRVGILTIKEKWEKYLGTEVSVQTESYLQERYPLKKEKLNCYLNAAALPNETLVKEVLTLKEGQGIYYEAIQIAYIGKEYLETVSQNVQINFSSEVKFLNYLWDIFSMNESEIINDFKLVTHQKESQKIPDFVYCSGNKDLIFIEEGAVLRNTALNTENGPIYIGKNSELMEFSSVKGPFAILDDSTIKMGAKIYKGTTVGPRCKVGGEVNNVVFFGNSSKSHDGYLGNSVIGEWCNIGADTNVSNLKNNYEPVKLWDYKEGRFKSTGLQFCGLIMGDHSKTGINTMINTGTVVGVSVNLFGAQFPRNFIPSFSWGGAAGLTTYKLEKAIDTARKVLKRRNLDFNSHDEKIFSQIFNKSADRRGK